MATSFQANSQTQTSAVPPSADAPRPRAQSYSQAQSPSQSQSQSQSRPKSHPQSEPQKSQSDGKTYYGYLFNEDKSPTDILDALLRAIGQYIIDHIGEKSDKHLTARKLAGFYRTVGGDYDSLFLKSPDRTLSYIWQALGVQHTYQPTDNDYVPPSIPALTLRGFVRWESLQILLGPEEHVPFLQYAVANWHLKHPYTGEPFPVDLPVTAFPATCDPAVDNWHRTCGQKLREAATPNDDEEHPLRRHTSDPRMHATYASQAHSASTGTGPHHRPEAEYFRRRRPTSYVHVPEQRYSQHTSHSGHTTVPETKHRASSSSSLEEFARGQRPSDVKPPPPVREDVRSSVHSDPRRPPNVRRHSHSYQTPYAASLHDSDSDPDTLRAPKQRHNSSIPQPPPTIRRIPVAPAMPATAPSRVRRSEVRTDEPRSMNLKQKLASFILAPSERQRSSSRERGSGLHSSVRYRKDLAHNRLSRSLSGESYTSDGSLPEISPRYSSRDSRERHRARERIIERDLERERERERERVREREEELERKSRKERDYLRPVIDRRTSSHADIDRRRQDVAWDPRDRRRDSRDLEREVRRTLTSDELDRRERRRYHDSVPTTPMTGVGGRRYPR